MDLVGVIADCAIGVDAQLMHALVWNESRGSPWSFRTEVVGEPRVYRSRAEAVREALRARTGSRPVRIGLTGLAVAPVQSNAQAIEELIEPCANVKAAARRLTELQNRCFRELRFGPETVRCTFALWRGSLTGQALAFADAVRADAAGARLPNFDLDERPDTTDPATPSATLRRPPRAPEATRSDVPTRRDPLDDGAGDRTLSEGEQARRAPLFVQPTGAPGAGERAVDQSAVSTPAAEGQRPRPAPPGSLFPARPQAAKPAAEPLSPRTSGEARDAAIPPSARTPASESPPRRLPPATVFVPPARDRGQP